MLTESCLYWITRVDTIKDISCVVLICSGFFFLGAVIFSIVFLFAPPDSERIASGVRRGVITIDICLVISALAYIFTPSTKELIFIKVIPAVVNSKEAAVLKADLGELYTSAVEYAKERVAAKNEGEQKCTN